MVFLREEILKSAAHLFIQHGYSGLSMREIAESVGVTKAALYYHFKDKEDLFLAILEVNLIRIEGLIEEIETEETDCRKRIDLFVRRILSQPVDQRAIIRLASQEMAQLCVDSRKTFGEIYHNRFIRKISEIIDSGITAGEIRSVDPNVATWSLLGMMYPYFYPVHSDDLSPSEDAINTLVEIFLYGAASGK